MLAFVYMKGVASGTLLSISSTSVDVAAFGLVEVGMITTVSWDGDGDVCVVVVVVGKN